MVRGWHGIKQTAFFLPDVFLDNTHTNGKWIQSWDTEWKKGKFSLSETHLKLKDKAGSISSNKKYTLYESSVIHQYL